MKEVLAETRNRLVSPLLFSILGLGLLFGRMLYMSNSRFSFMAWNLFLAWLPLLWVTLLIRGLKRHRWLFWSNIVFSLLWLAFLPNSFYMITDFIHLGASSGQTLLFDSMLFLSFALAGILTGCVSIFYIHREFAKRFERDVVVVLLLSCFVLNGLAIFLGRNLGWNSWDLLINPFLILSSFVDQFRAVDMLSRMLGITMLFFVFVTICYAAFYTLMNPRADSGSKIRYRQR